MSRMAFAVSAEPADSRVVDIGPLALLRPLVEQLDVAAVIDRHIPTDADVSHGTVLAILLAARLHKPTALVNLAEWARQHGAEYLWNVAPEKLNDDRLARALDAFFPLRHDILADITRIVLELTDLTLQRCHFDTTHLVLYGAYDDSRPRPQGASQGASRPLALDGILDELRDDPAHVTHGYLTSYKMLQLGVVSVVDDLGPVPVGCHLFDGNRNGHTGIAQQYELLRSTLRLPENLLMVSDRGTCSAAHLARLARHGHHALCAAPWHDYLSLFEEHADAGTLHWKPAGYRSMEQQRRRDCGSSLPLEEYRLAVVTHALVDPETRTPLDCRVVFVHSSAAERESRERRAANVEAIGKGLARIAQKLERGHPSTTHESVTKEIARLCGKRGAANLFRWELVPLTEAERAALPAPKKGHRKPTHRLVHSFDEAAARAEERHDGVSALVTTAPPTSWSCDALFTEYKRQTYVERGHHELKTPLAVTPIFLKTPERVESLVSLLFVALQASMTLERRYRQRMRPEAPMSERRMTAERLLRSFEVCGLVVEEFAYGEQVQAGRLRPEQRRILHHLSLSTPSEILRRTLAPPPTS